MQAHLQKKTTNKGQFVEFLPSCNWILSKKLFNEVNQMDGKMLRNEDWDFVYNRMKKENYKVFYSPKTIVYHENKKFSDFVLKRFRYGYYMWPILLKFNLYNFYFLLPLFFSIFLLSFPLILFNSIYQTFYASIILIYLSVVFFETARVSKNLADFVKIPFFIIPANLLPGFGILFGFFKGYVVSICLFSIFNWFYPYQNWGISAEDAFSFNIVKKGSEILVDEFPTGEDFIDTKDKIEKI